MAEIITEKEFNKTKTVYPWHEWTDGQCRKATKGVDFDCPVASFTASIYGHARRKGFYVKATRKGNDVYFQFLAAKKEGPSTTATR